MVYGGEDFKLIFNIYISHRESFVVPGNTERLSIGKPEDKHGIRASSTCGVLLENVRVPATNMLGEEGKGYKIAIETLNEGRIGIAGQGVGLAQRALDLTLDYIQEREQFGQPIANFQLIQASCSRMATDLEAARLLTYHAAALKEAGMPFVREAAMAKLYASEMAQRVARMAMNNLGGVGYTREYEVEKLLRDAGILTIYEGTTNMQLLTIFKHLQE